MTAKDLIKLLEKDGWIFICARGSHYYFKHPTKKGKICVPVHKGDIKIGTYKAIIKQAGL